jgi:hypothetical protein
MCTFSWDIAKLTRDSRIVSRFIKKQFGLVRCGGQCKGWVGVLVVRLRGTNKEPRKSKDKKQLTHRI